ncbi:phosphoribosylformylglycinamidine synthase subunit PurQ [Profundibacterium mesophilum]|uniref:Phosphoribosylformylglycinamidine synthase subunit PurQ n=1 Tax=Profundibacterium mesophilum KAUST100406-0324 TaxID=1037889 RepID=A0A921NSF7_9RHOB|nr:phosphoribosylformylglycinamidine synthase subunit PurQ [Profundibacterium mesophilum]KAF0677135.1 Phosphoribosylformylglycinamidine synthase 1 [Profundibacterium mesophilum KAUST100406-0324]
MKVAVIVFPGSNCDRDMVRAFELAGAEVSRVWHKETALPAGIDLIGIPGGFSFGDYLRCGAIAARSPICGAVREHAGRGGYVLGVCNGFQILAETGLLPGALMRNRRLKYICRTVPLTITSTDSPFTARFTQGQQIALPIAHHDGNYNATPEQLELLRGEDRIVFTYDDNPNGSVNDIAGIVSANRRVLGMMPHPERAVEAAHGNTDGAQLFAGLMEALGTADA